MKSFIKIFFASFLALVIFSLIVFFVSLWLIGGVLQSEKPALGSKAVLVLDLSVTYKEQGKENLIGSLTGDASADAPGLYDVIRMFHYAKTDSAKMESALQEI